MQWAAIGRHCVMLLALPGFLEFPLFLMRVTFCARHNESRWRGGGALKVAQFINPPLLFPKHLQLFWVTRCHGVTEAVTEAASGGDVCLVYVAVAFHCAGG